MAAARVVQTGDLRARVSVAGNGRDELGRLAETINEMLTALERSVGSQRQLVADASHELRTPLTTLITNLQLLDEPGGLRTRDAGELVAAAVVQPLRRRTSAVAFHEDLSPCTVRGDADLLERAIGNLLDNREMEPTDRDG